MKQYLDKISLELMRFSTFIEIKNEDINSIYISEEKNITETLYIEDGYEEGMDKYFKKEKLGTTLISIVNNYDKIIEVIDKYKNVIIDEKNKLSNSVTRSNMRNFNDFCVNIIFSFKDELINISEKLCILNTYIYQFLKDFNDKYLIEISKNNKEIEILHFTYKQFRRFFEKVKILMIEGKKLIDNSFVFNEQTRNHKFSKDYAILPSCKIEFITENVKFPHPFKYNYSLVYPKDIFIISIYQLVLNHKVIIKCKNCGKYSIPDRTHKQYCDKNCKSKYFTSTNKENEPTSYNYYRILYNRYKNTKTYKEDFDKLKTIYYNQYKTKQINEQEFMQILLDFEQTVENKYSLKRGRPKKNKNA